MPAHGCTKRFAANSEPQIRNVGAAGSLKTGPFAPKEAHTDFEALALTLIRATAAMPNIHREKEIFSRAMEIENTKARSAYVTESCRDDAALAERVRALLEVCAPAERMLPDAPSCVQNPELNAPAMETSGTVVGRYRLLEPIGEGGFGVVFMADQLEPVKRRVALKVLKPGMDSRQVIGRFEAERQALALMSHPNIAQVLDAGISAHGRPYFVMELVRGIPITQFCREHPLDLKARLHLYIDVCMAVQHAHQKGIIHRDLKPSNILVTLHGDHPVAKVIDFGIAKSLDQPLTDRTVFTHFHQFLGTPAYMSPEQATLSQVQVDTRSDIYSLGVLLYELLTGSPPFRNDELVSAGLDEMRRIIREVAPERPSTRLRRSGNGTEMLVAARHSPFASDLDRIVLKAIQKDPDLRYPTANGLAMDIRRYLANEPVEASPPSVLYRFQKYFHRRRWEVAAVLSIAVLLLAGIITSTSLALRARRAEKFAQVEADTSAAVAEFYWKDLLKQLSEGDFTNRTVTLREALDVAAARAPIRLAEQPLAEATVRLALGAAYSRRFDYVRTREHIERAVDLRLAHLGENHFLTAEALLALADFEQASSNPARAFYNFARARAILTRLYGPHHPQSVRAAIHEAWNHTPPLPHPENTDRLKKLVRLSETVRGSNDVYTRIALNYLGLTYQTHGDLEEACRIIGESYRRSQIDEGPEDGNSLIALGRLAKLHGELGRFSEAMQLYDQVLEVRLRNFGPAHPYTLIEFEDVLLLSILLPQHQYSEAIDAILHHIERCATDSDTSRDWRPAIERCLDLVEEHFNKSPNAPIQSDATALQPRLEAARASLANR
jgi:eukaryotic-like serine/threonine-protein kinase